jgi:hypothetical protein
LYLALRALKDLEPEATQWYSLETGTSMQLPEVGPRALLGIELNVDTARTSASPRPGLSVTYRWSAVDAERPGFVPDLRAALWEALVALSEPLTALSPAHVR